jgi:hypothetical protein
MEPQNIGGFLSRLGAGLGRGVLALGTGGISELGMQRRDMLAQQEQLAAQQEAQQRQALAQIIASPMTPDQKLQALAQLGTADAVAYAQELAKPADVPASIKEFQAVQAMTPEQRAAFQAMQNPITPFQREQLALERAKLESGADFQRMQANQRAQALELQARALEQAGRRQEAAAVRAEAAIALGEVEEPKMFQYSRVPDPLARINDPKRRDIAMQALGTEAQKAIEAQQENVDKAMSNKAAMEKFEAAMQRQGGTGGQTAFLAGVRSYFDPEIADMLQVTAETSPLFRQPGSGASSDYDAKQFERANVSVDKPTETNAQIITARKLAADNVAAKADFLEAYRADNGHIRGAESEWRRYLNDNSIFDKSKPNSFELNPNRRDWREYFGGTQQVNAPTPTAGGITLPPASAIEAELRRRGAM